MTSLPTVTLVLLTPKWMGKKEGYAEFEKLSNTLCDIMNLSLSQPCFLAWLPSWQIIILKKGYPTLNLVFITVGWQEKVYLW